MLRNVIGVVVSALIVCTLYLGPGVVGVLYGLVPHDMVQDLGMPERTAVFDGAWEISEFEQVGDMDGDVQHVVDPTLQLGKNDQEAQAGDSSNDGVGEAGGAGGEVGRVQDSLAVPKPGAPVPTKGVGSVRGKGTGTGAVEKEAERSGTTRKKSRHKCPKKFDGISKRKNGTFTVKRSLVNYHTSSVKRFNELGWSKNNDKGDKKGWYVSGFGCKDALWHAGIRRRDVILTVNGKKTNNMMQILMLYTKVKAQSSFTVRVRRKGKVLTLKYVLVK